MNRAQSLFYLSISEKKKTPHVSALDAVIRETLARFAALGLSPDDLCRWRRRIPITYPWNARYNTLRLNVNGTQVTFPMAIVMCETEREVVAIQRRMEYARAT